MIVQKLNNHEFSVEFTPEDLKEYGVEVLKIITDLHARESVLQLALQTVLESFDIESPHTFVSEVLSINTTTHSVMITVTFPGDVPAGNNKNTVGNTIYLLLQNLEDGACVNDASGDTRLLRTSPGVYVLEVAGTDYEKSYMSYCEGFEVVEKPTNYTVIIGRDAVTKLKLIAVTVQ